MLKKLGLTAFALCGFTSFASAADLAPIPSETGWVFTAAPYLWAIGMSGDVGSGTHVTNIDITAADVLSHLDLGFMGAGEVRNGPISFSGDLIYAKLSAGKDVSLGPFANHVELTTKMAMVTGLAGYSVIYGDGGNLDVVAGARMWSLDNALAFSGGTFGSFDDSHTWVDPLIGFKGRANISPDFYLTGWALAGGFGAASNFVWDVMGSVGYNFNKTFSMTAGYRAMGVDFRKPDFTYSIVQGGPIVGFVFKF
jgi:hypothetical protein